MNQSENVSHYQTAFCEDAVVMLVQPIMNEVTEYTISKVAVIAHLALCLINKGNTKIVVFWEGGRLCGSGLDSLSTILGHPRRIGDDPTFW